MAAYISFQPSDFFNASLFTGTGSALSITGVGFQPDWVVAKYRGGSENWGTSDAVRGATENLYLNLTQVEATQVQGLTAFDSDGFSVGTRGEWNTSGSMISHNWKAGTTTGIDLDSASITPTGYSFNVTSGFSIIRWRGVVATAPNTIPHGLGVKPEMILIKNLSSPDGWIIYHAGLGATKYMVMNTATSAQTSSDYWNDTEPTTTKFTTNTGGAVAGGSTEDLIAYCFASKKGYSKIGSYLGNNNVDGAFVYTGFRPAYVLVKNSDSTDVTVVMDSKRLGYNNQNRLLSPTNGDEEEADGSYGVSFVSNGFKCIRNNGKTNGSANTMCYIAFAEFPFVSSNSIPTTAR